VEAFANFRRVRIPRVHGVQRLSLANMKFRHMKDTAKLKEAVDSGKASVRGNVEWVWKYEVVNEWDKAPTVPAAYAVEAT
jgi:salicylate hydroxylase